MIAGDHVILSGYGPGCIVPDGQHVVSAVLPNGGFCVDGGRTVIWPTRIAGIRENQQKEQAQ